MAAGKIRLDRLITAQGFAKSRSHAQDLIAANAVAVDNQTVSRPGMMLPCDAAIAVNHQAHPFVSRGGEKLIHGLEFFAIDVADKHCLDVGASTGGFTDALLQAGAAHVVAVDVGHGQLDESLRQDDRVTNLEKTDIRALTPQTLSCAVEFLCCDVSFISLEKLLPHLYSFMPQIMLLLFKPQFEVGRFGHRAGFVTPENVQSALKSFCSGLVNPLDSPYIFRGFTASPLPGRKKSNREYLIFLEKS